MIKALNFQKYLIISLLKMNKYKSYFHKKKILITGHTGFKGAWLSLYLLNLGGKILGISKGIPTQPSLFNSFDLKKKIIHQKMDIKNLKNLKKIFLKFNPDYVFHLAAQSLVKKSYQNPLNTWSTNLIGTLNIMECLRVQKKKSIAVIITSDKAYKNIEIKKGYKETDQLGGTDPYGASKSAADIAINSYIKSFFHDLKNNKRIAIARAGNVIGGGDWSEDRLLPDCFKKWTNNKKVTIRSPNSTRPWQHVIDVIRGYVILAINLSKNKRLHGEAFNFGPSKNINYRVINILNVAKIFWPTIKWKIKKEKNFFENSLLNLNSDKAKKYLNWKTKIDFKDNIRLTVEWYRKFAKKDKDLISFSLDQIKYIEKK